MWTRLAVSHSVVLLLAVSLPNLLPKELDEKVAELQFSIFHGVQRYAGRWRVRDP